jgi:hypothetical protein
VAQLELNLVRGLGHGVPLSTSGEEGLGYTAPYMLEAGISSTLEIARFWGLVHGQARPNLETAERLSPELAVQPSPEGAIAQGVMNTVGRYVPAEVSEVIAKALRAAGLMHKR